MFLSRMARAVSWLTGYAGIPPLSRPTFRNEYLAIFTFALAAAAMDGGFARYFVITTLQGPAWILAAVVSAGAVGNFTAALVVPVLSRRRQKPVLVARMVICGALLAIVSILPAKPVSAYIFAIIILLIATLNATWTNARTTLWQSNYPTHLRGQIISRFTVTNLAVLSLLVWGVSWMMDRWDGFYRVLFALGGASAIVTALFYLRVRFRGEPARLRQQTQDRMRLDPLELVAILRKDKAFARYMLWQMLLGSATLLGEPVLAMVLADRFGFGYGRAIAIMTIVPMMVQLASTPILGRWYDRINIFLFRGTGAACWAMGRFLLFWGTSLVTMPLMFMGSTFTGLGGSFGGLAWSLGHMNFAPPSRAPLYMGVHMLLTGVRGATMPFLGVYLYQHTAVGYHLFWITGALHLVAAIGTWSMRNVVLPFVPPPPQSTAPPAMRMEA